MESRKLRALIMHNWRSIYWKLFNVLGRIVGVLFFAVGLTIGIYGFVSLRSSQIQPFEAWLMIVLSLIVAVLGFLLIIARPYRPENSKNESDNQ